MNRIRFEPDNAGIQAFLHSGEVENLVGSYAAQVAARAGEGMKPSTWSGSSRVIGSVETDTREAARRQSKHQALLKALY